jgi:Flp pilus assembly protein TadD
LLTRQNDNSAAVDAWKKAVELDGANNDARLSLAVLYDRMGRSDDALDAYRSVEPRSVSVQKRVEYLEKLAER